jgi:hypothetical protein
MGNYSFTDDFGNEESSKKVPHFQPIFKSKIERINSNLCFVLMPFTQEWSKRVYEKYIQSSIEKLGYQCLRADELNGQIVMEDVWVNINQAAFIIADVTGKNPNVMYELGIVHTLGKPCILITQDASSIPFDFRHLRHYEYKDNIDGLDEFELRISKAIREILS